MTLKDAFDGLLLKRRRKQAKRHRVIRNFAEEAGLVYFGTVDQHNDEHKVIRGFTISSTHRDDSYTVGEYEGYPVGLVDRFDVLKVGGKVEKHAWIIAEFELNNTVSLPHTFMLPTHHKTIHYGKIFTAFRSLEKVDHPADVPDFHSRYELFSTPDQHETVEELFNETMIRTIAAHFWPAAVEVNGSQLHVYLADTTLTQPMLRTLLQNSVWLCQTLEKSVETT